MRMYESNFRKHHWGFHKIEESATANTTDFYSSPWLKLEGFRKWTSNQIICKFTQVRRGPIYRWGLEGGL